MAGSILSQMKERTLISGLAEELINEINKIRADKRYSDISGDIEIKELSNIVRHYTNLNVKIKLNTEYSMNANVKIPLLDVNHIQFESFNRAMDSDFYLSEGMRELLQKDLINSFAKSEDKVPVLNGTVDVANGKVHGLFSEIESPINLAYDLFYTKTGEGIFYLDSSNVEVDESEFKAEHLTAILLHEVGHLMTYYTLLGVGYTSNLILDLSQRVWSGTESSKDMNYKFVKTLEDQKLIEEGAKDKIANGQNPDTMTTIVADARYRRVNTTYGTKTYSSRNIEALADKYVAQNGLHLALAEGLAILNKDMKKDSPLSSAVNMELIITTALYNAAFVLFSLQLVPLVILLVLIDDTVLESKYDDPKERIIRLKRDLIDKLVNSTLNSKDRKKILRDIDAINDIIDDYSDNLIMLHSGMDLGGLIVNYMTGMGRRARLLKDIDQTLERMQSNDIHVTVSKLKELSKYK